MMSCRGSTGLNTPKPASFLLSVIAGFTLLWLPPSEAAAMSTPNEIVTPGGVTVWHVEDNTNPLISVSFAFRGGVSQDAPDKAGTTNMMVSLLDEGAGDLDSLAFKKRLRDTAVQLSFTAGKDTINGSLSTLSTRKQDAFDLLRLALTEPRFDEEPVERVRNQIAVSIRRGRTDPQTIAGEAFRVAVFGEHPYGRDRMGTEESVAAITRDDLVGAHRRLIARDNLYVAVVGDIDAEALASWVDKAFSALPESAELENLEDVQPVQEAKIEIIDMDVPQAAIQFGLPGLKRDHPDFITAFVVNHIFGGGSFSSRLFNEVREQRGLAYSVFSQLWPLDHAGVVAGGAGTENARVKEALEVIYAELAKMAAEGPTEEELEKAKQFMTGSFALRFDSSSSIARQLLGQQLDNLGIDYIERRNDLIRAVTIEDARRVARELYDPAHLKITVVGQPEGDLSAVIGG